MGPFVNLLCRNRRFFIVFLIGCACCGNVRARDSRTLDMAGLISSASKLLGLDMADGVANLVSAAFGQPPRRRGDAPEATAGGKTEGPPGVGVGGAHGHSDHQPPTPSLFAGLLKLVGLDPSKLGALALNAVIFVAQMVSNSLIGGRQQPTRKPQIRYPTPPAGYPPGFPTGPGSFRNGGEDEVEDDEEPEGTPVSWMLNNPMLKDSNLMRTAQDPALADHLEQVVRSRSARSVGDGGGGAGAVTATPCIQQLVCRSAPFVWAMQRSLKDLLYPGKASPTAAKWNSLTPVQRMYAYLPEASEVEERAKMCREKLPACRSTVL